MKKATELTQGDIVKTTIYSSMWNRIVETTGTVMCVTFFGENASVMVKAMDGCMEFIQNVYATPDKLFQLA